ncbi:hypothetical protein JW805_18415 [Roseomonas aeriglobus]|nr:hypothetical protein [Roseomonas aeriglobus]
MNSNKRSRGRPVGTGLNDGPTLKKVADMIVANPSLRPTTAIRRALDKPEPSSIRRLQVKWKAGKAQYMAEAQARRAAASMPARRVSAPYSPRTGRHIAEAHRKMQEALGPGFRAAQEMMNSPGMRAAQEAARRYQESPALRAIEEFRNSPTMRAIEELQNNPTVRLMRELQDSPMMRAAREMEKVQRLINGGF